MINSTAHMEVRITTATAGDISLLTALGRVTFEQTFARDNTVSDMQQYLMQNFNEARITEELARYQRSAVPFNLIWVPKQESPVILPEILTAGTVLEALKNAAVPPMETRVTTR